MNLGKFESVLRCSFCHQPSKASLCDDCFEFGGLPRICTWCFTGPTAMPSRKICDDCETVLSRIEAEHPYDEAIDIIRDLLEVI